MKLLYNIGIRTYSLSILTAGLFGNKKAVDWVEGRRDWVDHLTTFRALMENREVLWVHASSLGEFEQAKPFIEELKRNHSDEIAVLVTFFSPSGYNYAKEYKEVEGKMYLPIDTKANAKLFLDILQPVAAVFVKYDFWFNTLKELQKKQIPTIYFSSKFRRGQFFFKKGMEWQLNIMKKIDVIQTHDKKSYELLKSKGFNNVSLGGDTRFDKVWQNKDDFQENEYVQLFKKEHSLFLVGSSWPPEEQLVAAVQNEIIKLGYKICIAPHDIAESHIEEIKAQFPNHVLYSNLVTSSYTTDAPVLIIDNIGLLKSLYYYSDVAFVGGGFTNKLHNILEPAVFGNVVLFGNNHDKFPEGNELLQYGGAFEITSSAELIAFFENIVSNEEELFLLQNKSINYIESNKGATAKLYSAVEKLIKPKPLS